MPASFSGMFFCLMMLQFKKVWNSWVKNETDLVAPSLLFYEITNGLYQQQKNKYLSPETIWKSLEYSLDLPITLVNEKNLHLPRQRNCHAI